MKWVDYIEEYDTELLIIFSTAVVSHGVSQWIQENYALFEYVFLILLFGLIHEAWSSLPSNDALREFIEIFGVNSTTSKQVALLWFIGATVFLSLWLQDLVEGVFGPLSVVQMLALIVLLSRAFVNVYVSKNLFAILDGQRDTYADYTAGVIAFLASWQIQDYYAAYTQLHNMLSIWPSLIIAWLLFYRSRLGDNLPDFTTEKANRRKQFEA